MADDAVLMLLTKRVYKSCVVTCFSAGGNKLDACAGKGRWLLGASMTLGSLEMAPQSTLPALARLWV